MGMNPSERFRIKEMATVMKQPVLKALLGATLFVAPLTLLGCPSPKATMTDPPVTAGVGAISKDGQTKSIQSSVTAIQATLQDLTGSMQGMLKQAAGVRGVQSVGMTPQWIYRALATTNTPGVTIGTDGQLASLTATDSALTLAFTGNGSPERTAAVNLTQSADGTVGSAKVDVTADAWLPTPGATDSFQIWYNQMPDFNRLEALSAALDVTPQGQAAKHVSVSAGCSNFGPIPTASGSVRLPNHFFVKGFVPRVTMDQTLDLKSAGSTQVQATVAGTLSLDITTQGIQSWRESVTLSSDTATPNSGSLQFSFENLTEQYKLVGSLQPKAGGGELLAGQFVSSVDSSALGTLSFDSSKDANAYILLTNGTRIDLKPHS